MVVMAGTLIAFQRDQTAPELQARECSLRLRSWMNDFIDKFVNWMLIKITVLPTQSLPTCKLSWILRRLKYIDWLYVTRSQRWLNGIFAGADNNKASEYSLDTGHLTALYFSHRTSDSEKTDSSIVSQLIQRLLQLVLTFEWFKLKVLMRFQVSCCWIFSPEIFVSDVSQLTSV